MKLPYFSKNYFCFSSQNCFDEAKDGSGSFSCDSVENRESEDEEFTEVLSPISSKRLKVSDINISRYYIFELLAFDFSVIRFIFQIRGRIC